MILLRRGRGAPRLGSSYGVDVTLDLEPVFQRQRHACFGPWRPPLEAFETESELIVRAEIGGISEQEVAVLVDDDGLIIRGERNVARPSDNRVYHESRVRYGPFEASVRLPFPIDVDQATANYLDGFLTVTLPRLAATRVPTADEHADTDAQRGGL
jgi:HSP20 family protein